MLAHGIAVVLLGMLSEVLVVTTDAPAGVAAGDQSVADPKSALAVLEPLVGPWAVTETHFNRLGKVVATASGSEETSWVLDGHAIRRTYTSGTSEPPYRAIGMITWDEGAKRFVGAWFDNRSLQGPRVVSGEWNEQTRSFVWMFESVGPDGKMGRFRRVERLINEDERIATTFQIDGSEVTKRLEVHYRRTAPCPSSAGVRRFMGEVGGGR